MPLFEIGIETRDGEIEYTQYQHVVAENMEQAREYADEYLKSYWGEPGEEWDEVLEESYPTGTRMEGKTAWAENDMACSHVDSIQEIRTLDAWDITQKKTVFYILKDPKTYEEMYPEKETE